MHSTTRTSSLSPGTLLIVLLAAPAWAGEAERAAAEQAMLALYESQQYEEALDAATLLIEYTTDEFGANAPELIDPLINVGDINQRLKQWPRALAAYERAAIVIEINENVFSTRLVDVLRRVGETYDGWQHSEEAVAALQRAKVITHHNYGIMNLEQIPIIEDLTEIYAKQLDTLSAGREQRFALRVNERRYGADNPDVVPGLFRLAEWYQRTRQWPLARDLYRRAATILENAYGDTDLRLVEALSGIADTYRGERALRGDGREALEHVVRVYETVENADVADHGAALIALGDWQLLTGHVEDAMDTYTRAWQLLATEGGSPESAQQQLGRPTRLRYEQPPPELDLSGPDAAVEQVVEVQFTVKVDGSVDDAVVVSTTAPNRLARQVKLAVLQARYRPAFEDGRPVPKQVLIRQRYPAGPLAAERGTEGLAGEGTGAAETDPAPTPAAVPPPEAAPETSSTAPATEPPAEPAPETL